MKHLFATLSLINIVIFSGCFGTFGAHPNVKRQVGADVRMDKKVVAYTGGVLLNRYNYFTVRGIRITESIQESFLLGNLVLKEGEFLQEYKDDDNADMYFCGKNFQPIGQSEPNGKACLIKGFDDFESFIVMYKKKNKGKPFYMGPFTLTNILSYEKVIDNDKTKSFEKKELIFDACQRDMLFLTYKEYFDSPHRASYSSQLVYPLNRNKPTLIHYKGATIKVYGANEEKIVYKIMRPFDNEE